MEKISGFVEWRPGRLLKVLTSTTRPLLDMLSRHGINKKVDFPMGKLEDLDEEEEKEVVHRMF